MVNNSKFVLLSVIVHLTIIVQAQSRYEYPLNDESYYSPKLLQTDISHVKAELTSVLKAICVRDVKDVNRYSNIPKKVSVYDDRIEMTLFIGKITIYFSELLRYTIAVNGCRSLNTDGSLGPLYYCSLTLGDFTFFEQNVSLAERKTGDAMKLADYLYYIQQHFHIYSVQQRSKQRYDSLLTLFNPIAAQYRELKIKPPVSEEQREFIVQANLVNQKKMYETAIELYISAIKVNPTSYPAAYSNLALLSAQINRFDAAIYYMKKYLLLEPEAPDARSAQDKIYEWKILVTK